MITSVSCCSRFIFSAEKFLSDYQSLMFMSVYLFYTTKYVTSRLSNFYWPTAANIPWEKVRWNLFLFRTGAFAYMFLRFSFLFFYSFILVDLIRRRCSSIDWGCRKINYSNSLVYSRLSLCRHLAITDTTPLGDKSQTPRRNAQRNSWNNSRLFGLPLLRKSRFVQTPDSHEMKRHHDKGK